MRLFKAVTIVLILSAWICTYADADSRGTQLMVDSNDIVKLDRVLQQVRHQFPGRVLKVELEDEDDAPSGFIYEVKILKHDGSVIEVEYDAKTLKVLEVEGDDWQNRQLPSK